jgi:hypothetical protein
MKTLLAHPKATLLLFAAVALLCLLSCEDERKLPAPNQVIPNSAQLTKALMNARYVSERAAAQVRRLRARQGQDLYEIARQANNVAISQMRQALVTPGRPLSANEIYNLLLDADNKRNSFLQWCRGAYDANYGDGSWATSMGDPASMLIDLAKLYTDWVQIQEAREQQQRAVILDELQKCEWASWSDVRE